MSDNLAGQAAKKGLKIVIVTVVIVTLVIVAAVVGVSFFF